jgi:hypothetical protein
LQTVDTRVWKKSQGLNRSTNQLIKSTIPVIDGIKHRGGFNEIADGSDPMFKAIEKFTNLLPDESTMASDESTGATDSVNQVGELDSMSEVTTKVSSSSASAGARVCAIQGEANPFTTSVEAERGNRFSQPGWGTRLNVRSDNER